MLGRTDVPVVQGAPADEGAAAEIVVMGGVFLEQTSVGAMPGEYNFWCDLDAAQTVMESGAALRLADGGAFGGLASEHTLGWIDFQERVKPREELEQGSCALAVANLLMWADPPAPNCRIATAVDAEAFRELFVERMASLP
ncbi:hypothetical protein [Nocardioides aquiterrae]|uniref:Inosine/uridine-preferring nucleoside hydrolase domain-containing protein n=1 Tax=Nocardioides aquiterrae TaxID=203799 RepID=A0ABP4F1N1_9ACTN